MAEVETIATSTETKKPKLTSEERKARRVERKAFLAAEEEKWGQESARREAARQALLEKTRAQEAAEREEILRPKSLRIVNRGLVDVLAWHPHHRGRNWVALVEIEPTLPGGLKRSFFPRASGKVAKVVIPEGLKAGNILEFGADYVSYGGRREPTRIYGVVTGLTATELVVKPHLDLLEAQAHASSEVTPVRVRIA